MQPQLHHVCHAPLAIGKARVIGKPSPLVFAEHFHSNIARRHDAVAVGRERDVVSASASEDAGFDLRGKGVGFGLLIHHDRDGLQTTLIFRPPGWSAGLLVHSGALGPERSECGEGGGNDRNVSLQPE